MYWYMNKMEFADWLRREIEKRKTTIAEVAARGGTNSPTIWRIVRGERTAGVDSIVAIAKGLSVSPVEVFSHVIGHPLSERSEQRERVIYLFDQLTEQDKLTILNMLDFLLNK